MYKRKEYEMPQGKGGFKRMTYYPEGSLIDTPENRLSLTVSGLMDAAVSGKILEAKALCCDRDNTLHIGIPGIDAFIFKQDAQIGEGTLPIAILTRVGKPVCFKVLRISLTEGPRPVAILSRAAAQEECCNKYIDNLKTGDIVDAKITKIESFGAFADIGCGMTALLPIDRISVSRISSPADRFSPGQMVKAVICGFDRQARRITLSMRELLGTFDENAALFTPGTTVAGIVRSSLPYGVFIELTPNLSGLAESKEGLVAGQAAAVYIKSVIESKMKIKLSIVDVFIAPPLLQPLNYFISSGHIDYWRYSSVGCEKLIETNFSETGLC